MPYKNLQTGMDEELTGEALKEAIVTGTHALPSGEIEVVSPDNVVGTMPSLNVRKALGAGYRILDSQEKSVREYVDKNSGIAGAAKVALTQFGDELAMGIPEMIWEHEADPLERAKFEALKKRHDLANTLGGVAGFGGSLLVGGPLFKGAAKAGEIGARATETLAANLASRTGVDLTKRQAMNLATKIAAKGVGGAAEGAVLAAPHALTEAALGEPELAGEALLFGGGLGAILGSGAPAAKEILGLGGKAAKEGYTWLSGQAPTMENMKAKAAKIFVGFPEEKLEHYIRNSERINKNADKTAVDLMDEIDGATMKYRGEKDSAAEAARAAKDELNYNYRVEIENLKAERPGLQIGQDLVDDLSEARRVLGEQSEAADHILANAYVKKGREQVPVDFSRSDVLGRITKEQTALGPIVGEQKRATMEYLEGLKAQVKEGFEDKISGPDMRELMRTLRKENDSFWSREVGTTNSYAEKALLNVSEGMSDLIKKKVPLYGEKMAEMSPLASSLSEMQKRFGTLDKAMSALRGTTGEKGPILEGILKHYDGLRGTDFVGKLATYRRAKDLLQQSKLDDLSSMLLPEMTEKVRMAEAKAASLAQRNAPFDSLGERRTQAIIKNMGFKNPNEKDRRALEALSQLEGRTPGVDDFHTQIMDRNVLDAFDVERTNGSRRVNMGGSLGAAIGGTLGSVAGGPALGAVGAAVGAAAGGAADVYGGRVLKKLIDGETFLGPLFAESRLGDAARRLDKIPEILRGMSESRLAKRLPEPMVGLKLGLIRTLVGENQDEADEKQSERQQQKKLITTLTDRLSELHANPTMLAADVSGIISPFSSHGAPVIAGVAAQKLTRAVGYLYQEAPKPPRAPSPFSTPSHWTPSDYDSKKFLDKVEIVGDPFRVIDHLKNGTLTRSHVRALENVYPALYEQFKGRVFRAVADSKMPMAYTDRVKLSLLLGEPLDINMTPARIKSLQQTFQPPDAQPAAAENPPMTGGQTGVPINISDSQSRNTATDLTRRSMGG